MQHPMHRYLEHLPKKKKKPQTPQKLLQLLSIRNTSTTQKSISQKANHPNQQASDAD